MDLSRPPDVGRTRERQTHSPVPLTNLLKRTMANLKVGGDARSLVAWAEKQKGVIIEFGNERLLIHGKRKVALDAEGKPVWAVHLGRDKSEQTNVIQQQHYRWLLSPSWWMMRIWGIYTPKVRSRSWWVWRNLGSNE